MLWFWIFVGPGLLLAVLSLRGERKRAEYVAIRMAELEEPPAQPLPPVTLIVPVTHSSASLRDYLLSLASQDYPDYELIIVVPDAGYIPPGTLPPTAKVALAGETERAGLLKAGIRAARRHSQVFAFAAAGLVSRSWLDSAREDLALSRLVQESGRRIAFAPGAMVACTGRATAGQFLRQARREISLARRYLPRLWWSALLAHVIYCGGMLAAIIASAGGHRGAEWALVIQFGLGMLKGANRATLAKAELPHQQPWFARYSWTHTLWVPLATWVWLYVLIASAFGFGMRQPTESYNRWTP